jgi:hypothetical protein
MAGFDNRGGIWAELYKCDSKAAVHFLICAHGDPTRRLFAAIRSVENNYGRKGRLPAEPRCVGIRCGTPSLVCCGVPLGYYQLKSPKVGTRIRIVRAVESKSGERRARSSGG